MDQWIDGTKSKGYKIQYSINPTLHNIARQKFLNDMTIVKTATLLLLWLGNSPPTLSLKREGEVWACFGFKIPFSSKEKGI